MQNPWAHQNRGPPSHGIPTDLTVVERLSPEEPSWRVEAHRFRHDVLRERQTWEVVHRRFTAIEDRQHLSGKLCIDIGVLPEQIERP